MKNSRYFAIPLVALMMQSCLTTLFTVETRPVTVVTKPAPVVVTPAPVPAPNVIVAGVHHADYLDLRAVAAAFMQARTVQEFEMILNSQAYMINNIDLNGDGLIDYLRVREHVTGYHHTYLIQAVLAANWVETVANLDVECTMSGVEYIRVKGAPGIYGQNYVYQPVFTGRPPMVAYLHTPNYQVWNSPYGWNNYPSYYHKPAPVPHDHYVKYVNTYVEKNRYTHEPKVTTTKPTTTTVVRTETTKPSTTTTTKPATSTPVVVQKRTTTTAQPATTIKQPATQKVQTPTTTVSTTTKMNAATGRVSSQKNVVTDNNDGSQTTTTVRVRSTGGRR